MMSHMNYIKNQVGIEFSHYTATFLFPSPLFNIFRAESKKIFVGGLPTEVTEKEFADYFGTFGLVKVGWATGDICDSSVPLIPSLDWSGSMMITLSLIVSVIDQSVLSADFFLVYCPPS